MRYLTRYALSLLLASTVFALGACDDDDDSSTTTTDPAPSIAETVAASANFATLEAALDAAGLTSTFAEPGEFTVFAPTEAAFAALPDGALDSLLADIPALTEVLQYHVVSGKVDASAVVNLSSATTLLGKDIAIEVNTDGDVILNGGVKVTTTDIAASNGIIHVIDGVLLPPEEPPVSNTVVDAVVNDERFSTLETAVLAAGLEVDLSGTGPFTVFAPTNEAFDALPAGTLDSLLGDTDALADVLKYHVVSGKVDASMVATLSEAMALNGVDITVEVQDGEVILNGSIKVTETDIMVDNGIIHVIDAVLVPPPTIAAIVAADADFSTLNTAVGIAGLGSVLDGEGPLTVFAPTNAALATVAADDLSALLADTAALTDVLTYHVYAGKLLAADVVAANYFTMSNGAVAWIGTDGGPSISGVVISQTDIRARNGIIHVIDAVMIPPPTIAEIVSTNSDFSTLLAAVQAANLATTLDEGGPFTVFAPDNAAFGKIDAGALADLLADETALTDVLLYHVVDGVVPAAVAVTLTEATMKNGDDVSVAFEESDQSLMVNASLVTSTDIYARNGIIHVIDSVLFPSAE